MAKSSFIDRIRRKNEKIKAEAEKNKKLVANQKTAAPTEPQTFEEVAVAKKSETLMLD